MTYADNKCECCGHDDLPAGVASLSHAAMSIMWCHVCIKHGAEPKWVYEVLFDTLPCGMANEGLAYYEPADDTYRSVKTGEIIPVSMADGSKFNTRAEVVQYVQALNAWLLAQPASTATSVLDLSGISLGIQFEEEP